MPRKKASVRWCSSGNDRRRLRHFAFSLPLLSFSLSNLRALRFLFVFSFPAFVSFACFVRALLPAFVLSSSFFRALHSLSHSLSRLRAFPPPRICGICSPLFRFSPLFFRHPPLFLSPPFAFSLLEKHIPPIRRTLTNSTPRFYPIFCMIHMAENGAAIWNIPTIYVYLPSHSQKANTSSHPRVRNASQI